MSKCTSLAWTVFVGMAVALLVAVLTPATASAGQEKTNGQDKKESSHGMKNTGMATPSDMSSTGMTEEGKGKSKEKVIKADNMDRKKLKAQLDAASDDTVIEFKGKKTTKKELKVKAEKQRKDAESAMKAAPAAATVDASAAISQFNQQEKMKLDAANAKVRAEMTRLIRVAPGVEGTPAQANPATGSQLQRSLPVQQNVR